MLVTSIYHEKLPNYMAKLPIILLLVILGLHFVASVIRDKEYAHLPPVFELDNFDRCMLLEDEALYCYMEFHVQPLDRTNTSTTWQKIEELSKNPKNYHHYNLRHGICVPFACPSIKMSHNDPKFKEALAECYSKKYENLGLYGTIGEMNCSTNEPRNFDLLDHAVLIFFIAYALFVIFASFYEGLARYKSPEEYERATTGTTTGKILTSFSIPYNWYRLVSVKNDEETEALKPMQGVRFYNYVIVASTHVVLGGVGFPIGNTKWPEKLSERFITIFLSSGSFAVQTNFLISSWLLTYFIFKSFDGKSGKQLNVKNFLVVCFHRYLRLVTPLAMVILFHCTLLYHVGNDPLWDLVVGRERQFCRENGWTNMLMINNIINPERMCSAVTWYTAIDMHAFLLVLAILYFTVKKPERLWWIVPSTWVVTKVIQAKRLSDLNIYTFLQADPEKIYFLKGIYSLDDAWLYTMTEDLNHTGGTLVGVIAGYLFYKYRGQRIFTKKIHIVLWWIFTFGMCLSLIIFPGMWIASKSYYPSKLFSLTHFTISPALFAIGIALGILGFSKNISWFAGWVTKWKPSYVLGKLTYSAFLVHFPYLLYRRSISKQLEYLNSVNIVIQSMEVIVVSLIIGLILCLTVEFPTSAIQGLFLKKKNDFVSTRKNTSDKNYPTNINFSDSSDRIK